MVNDLLDQLDAASKDDDVDNRIRILRELLSISQQSQNKLGEIETLRLMGNAFQEKGEMQKSHNYRLIAEQLMREMGDDCPLNFQMQVEGDLGRSYIEAHDWQKAEELTRRALAKAESRNDEEGICIFKMNLGLVLANTNRKQESRDLGAEVLRIAKRLGNHYIQGLQYANLAGLMLESLELNDCQRHARKALAHAELSGNTRLLTEAKAILGRSYLYAEMLTGRREYSEEANQHLLDTLARAKSQQNYSVASQVEITLAELNERGRNFAEAGAHYQGAMELLEQVRRSLGYEEMQKTYFAEIQPTYDKVTGFLLRQGQMDEAFKTAERARSRMLLAMLGPKRRNTRSWPPGEHEALKVELDRYGRGIMARKPGEVTEARRNILRLYESKHSQSANWQSWQSPAIAEFRQIQQVLGADEALVAFVVSEDGLMVFAATNQARHFQHLNYPAEKLAADVEALTEAMNELHSYALDESTYEQLKSGDPRPRIVEYALQRLHEHLEKLFAILIAPIFSVVRDRPHWIIVPHGPLHRVSWPALRCAGSYLIEQHSISLLPSASLGLVLEGRPAPPAGEAIFFANPDPDHPDLQLPGSQREVDAASDALNAGPAPFVGPLANKRALFELAADASVLHLACHHFFDRDAPFLSFFKLAGDSGSEFVYSFELDEINLSAELVTLSACNSGRSKVETGDEQYGIVRAFLASGARSVLSTLWNIEDSSAAVLFTAFYRAAPKVGLAQALARSQRQLLQSSAYSLPNFWAPYVLSGRWNKPLTHLRSN